MMKSGPTPDNTLELTKVGPSTVIQPRPHPVREREAVRVAEWRADFSELIKLRLTTLVLITTFIGFLYGSGESVNWLAAFHAVLATGLVAAGAAAFNQVLEIRQDALMRRTANRPLPARRMGRSHAIALGAGLSIVGLLYLGLALNWLSAGLALLTLAIYVGVYTPLKQKTVHNTLIGAISGAIPPVIGWAAATDTLWTWEAAILFGILFFWQMPHFLAIAWMYREEYAFAGFRMWPLIDPTGRWTAWQTVLFSAALLAVSVMPVFLGINTWICGVIVGLLGIGMIWLSLRFLRQKTVTRARQLFLSTLLYLPAALAAVVFTIR